MTFYEEFISSRTFTPEQLEARRVNEYYREGYTVEADKQDYVNWLEQQLTIARAPR
jgi:hypothetical protein